MNTRNQELSDRFGLDIFNTQDGIMFEHDGQHYAAPTTHLTKIKKFETLLNHCEVIDPNRVVTVMGEHIEPEHLVVAHVAVKTANKLHDILELVVDVNNYELISVSKVFENHDKYSSLVHLEAALITDFIANTETIQQ